MKLATSCVKKSLLQFFAERSVKLKNVDKLKREIKNEFDDIINNINNL